MSIFSDDRFRGYSLSGGRPIASLDLSYEASGGLYAVLSGSVVAARGEGLRPLGLQINGGYAKRINSGLTLDIGATHSAYSHYSGLGRGRSYTEFYAGVVGKNVSSRLSVSPDYFGRGWTAHPEANGHVSLGQDFDLTGDVGVLIPFGGHTYSNPVYDARVGIDRRFGRLSLHAAFTSKGASRTVYHVHRSSRKALIFGVSYAL